MRCHKFGWAVAILAVAVIVGLAGTAQAVDWLRPDTTAVSVFDWNDTNNWQDISEPPDGIGDVPGIGGLTNVDARIPDWFLTQDVTLNVDQPVDLGTGEFYVGTRYYDMTIKDSSGTGSASLTCGTYKCWRSWEYTISEIPIYASTKVMLGWRWGYVRFENVVETPLVEVGDGDMTFTALPNPGDVYKFDTVTLWVDNQPIIPEMYVHDDIDPYTPGTPLAITIADGGIYGGYADGAFGTLAGNSVNITEGGTAIVGAAQTNLPTFVLEGGCTLAGEMTGLTSADFGLAGDGKKVTFAENVIYAPAPGSAEPTRAAMGDAAILVKGIYDTSAAGTTTVGDDGSTSLYKAAGFGAFGTSAAINTTVAVLPGIGNLPVFVTSRNADMGAGTGLESVTTQAVDFTLPAGAGYVNLVGPINNGVLTGPKATTFNFIGESGKEHDQVLRISDPAGEIAVGQTFNVKDGIVLLDTSTNTTFLKGTLEIDAGGALENGYYWAEPGDTQWHTPLSASGGTIHFKDRGLLFLQSGAEGIFENVNVTESGTPFVVVGSGPWDEGGVVEEYTLTAASTPQMLDLLKASNIWVNGDYDNTAVTFLGDGVTIGDGKWIQSNDRRTRDSRVAGVINAEPGTTIGIACVAVTNHGVFNIEADIEATGATVLFNTTETLESSVYVSANPAGNAHTNNRRVGEVVPNERIIVTGMITADTIKAQNGRLDLNQDLSVPNLDIASGATLTMAAGMTATVTNTLSGSGTWGGGDGVAVTPGAAVAPGASVGTISGNILNMNTGSTYSWEFEDETLAAGTGWDLVDISGLLTLANSANPTEKWTFDVVGLGGMADEATRYKVFEYGTLDAANDGGAPAQLTGVNITNSGGGYSVGGAGLYVDAGGFIYLEGLSSVVSILWDNGGGDFKWENAANWAPDHDQAPDEGTFPTIDTAGHTVILDTTAERAAALDLDQGGLNIMTASDLTVTADVNVALAGTLIVDGTLTAATVTSHGTLGGGGTIVGEVWTDGIVAPGGSAKAGVGTLTFDAGGLDKWVEITAEAQVNMDIGATSDTIVMSKGFLDLGGSQLNLSVVDLILPPDVTQPFNRGYGPKTVNLVGTTEDSAIVDQFTTALAAGDHLGRGIFVGPSGVQQTALSVKVDLLQAKAGDANGNRSVGIADDGTKLVLNLNTLVGMDWPDGDFNNDGAVDIGNDGVAFITNMNTFYKDVGPGEGNGEVMPDGSIFLEMDAIAVYAVYVGDDAGQEVWGTEALFFDDGVIEPVWVSMMTGHENNVNSDIKESFGELAFANGLTHAPYDTLVNVNPDGLVGEATSVWLLYQQVNQDPELKLLYVIPEPGTVAMLLGVAGALLLLAIRRRRRA